MQALVLLLQAPLSKGGEEADRVSAKECILVLVWFSYLVWRSLDEPVQWYRSIWKVSLHSIIHNPRIKVQGHQRVLKEFDPELPALVLDLYSQVDCQARFCWISKRTDSNWKYSRWRIHFIGKHCHVQDGHGIDCAGWHVISSSHPTGHGHGKHLGESAPVVSQHWELGSHQMSRVHGVLRLHANVWDPTRSQFHPSHPVRPSNIPAPVPADHVTAHECKPGPARECTSSPNRQSQEEPARL